MGGTVLPAHFDTIPHLFGFTMSRAKRWVFTLNNPTDDEEQAISECGEKDTTEYLVFGRETGDSGTPHFQGYVIFTAAVRLSTVKSRLGSDRFHLEVSRGTPKEASDYCKKDDNYEEFGECPEVSQGRRTDLDRFFTWADEFTSSEARPPTFREACRAHPTIVARCPRVMSIVSERYQPPPLVDGELRPWQREVVDRVNEPADDRQVDFVVDPAGGKGKSWLVKYLVDRGNVQFLSIGKRDDLAHAIQIQTEIFLIDVPRGQMEYLQYSVLEMLKNSLVFSPKYQSSMKRLLKTPHVVVFSNEEPNYESMTEDRYNIIQI